MSATIPDSPLMRLCHALAAALGDGWAIDPNDVHTHGCALQGPDARLFVRDPDTGGQREGQRITVSGRLPATIPAPLHNDYKGRFTWHAPISVAVTRPVAHMAADIERKLLPTLRQATKAALDHYAAAVHAREARHGLRDEVARLLVKARVHGDGVESTQSTVTGTGDPATEWTIHNDGTVDVWVRKLTPAQARKLIVVLNPT